MTLPRVFAKLWSAMPNCSSARWWAPSLARLNGPLLALVGSVLVEFATGVLDIDNYSAGTFNFNTVHY